MPGSVSLAAPVMVLPASLSRAFVHAREYPVQVNEYQNGESQRGRLADTSRKRWRISKRLTPAQLAALRDFYDARSGPQEPFFFDDPWEGRFTVRFEGGWAEEIALARADCQIELIEVA